MCLALKSLRTTALLGYLPNILDYLREINLITYKLTSLGDKMYLKTSPDDQSSKLKLHIINPSLDIIEKITQDFLKTSTPSQTNHPQSIPTTLFHYSNKWKALSCIMLPIWFRSSSFSLTVIFTIEALLVTH